MPDHRYYQAARDADARAEELGGLIEWAERTEIDLDPLVHLAKQRAIRCILGTKMGVPPSDMNLPIHSGDRTVEEIAGRPMPRELEEWIPTIMAAFIDGWAARDQLERSTDA